MLEFLASGFQILEVPTNRPTRMPLGLGMEEPLILGSVIGLVKFRRWSTGLQRLLSDLRRCKLNIWDMNGVKIIHIQTCIYMLLICTLTIHTPLCCQNTLFLDIFCAFKEVFFCYLVMFCNFQTTLNRMVTMYYRQISSPKFATREVYVSKNNVFRLELLCFCLHGKWAHVLVL